MLKNLNPITAARFGRLLDEREGLPEGEDRPVEAGERLELLSCPGEVRLGPGRGMAALCLCREGQAGDMFYLDKPVALKPGTEFALLPLEEGSAVRLAADRPLERAGSLPTAEPGLIRPTIRVERILTLFYQEKEPGFFFPGERHRPYELIYVDHGRLHNVVGGRDYALGQNQALIVPPDQWHMQYGEEGERVGFITASFTCAGPLPEEILLRVLDRDQTARELARALAAEEEREQPYRGDLLVAVLQAMLALWARRAAGGGGGGCRGSRHTARRVPDFGPGHPICGGEHPRQADGPIPGPPLQREHRLPLRPVPAPPGDLPRRLHYADKAGGEPRPDLLGGRDHIPDRPDPAVLQRPALFRGLPPPLRNPALGLRPGRPGVETVNSQQDPDTRFAKGELLALPKSGVSEALWAAAIFPAVPAGKKRDEVVLDFVSLCVLRLTAAWPGSPLSPGPAPSLSVR